MTCRPGAPPAPSRKELQSKTQRSRMFQTLILAARIRLNGFPNSTNTMGRGAQALDPFPGPQRADLPSKQQSFQAPCSGPQPVPSSAPRTSFSIPTLGPCISSYQASPDEMSTPIPSTTCPRSAHPCPLPANSTQKMLFKGGQNGEGSARLENGHYLAFRLYLSSHTTLCGCHRLPVGTVMTSKCTTMLNFTQTHPQSVVFIKPHNSTEMGKDVVAPHLQIWKLRLKKSESI